MKIGDIVTHVSYPGKVGRVVAKTKKWPGELQTYLVKWDGGLQLSRHIETALKKR